MIAQKILLFYKTQNYPLVLFLNFNPLKLGILTLSLIISAIIVNDYGKSEVWRILSTVI